MKIIIIVLLLMSFSACSIDLHQMPGQPSVFTESHSGQTVTVKSGDVITIKLNENPTTAYLWGIEKNPKLSKIYDNYTPTRRWVVGSGGIRTLKFRAEISGTTELKLKYWREWEGESSVVERFNLNITIL